MLGLMASVRVQCMARSMFILACSFLVMVAFFVMVVVMSVLDNWLGVFSHSLVAHVVDRRLLFVVLCDDLDYKVRVGRQSKLLISHINVRIHLLVILELFASKKAVIFALVFNLVLVLVFEFLLNDRFFNLFLQCLPLSELLLLEWCQFLFATIKAAL